MDFRYQAITSVITLLLFLLAANSSCGGRSVQLSTDAGVHREERMGGDQLDAAVNIAIRYPDAMVDTWPNDCWDYPCWGPDDMSIVIDGPPK